MKGETYCSYCKKRVKFHLLDGIMVCTNCQRQIEGYQAPLEKIKGARIVDVIGGERVSLNRIALDWSGGYGGVYIVLDNGLVISIDTSEWGSIQLDISNLTEEDLKASVLEDPKFKTVWGDE